MTKRRMRRTASQWSEIIGQFERSGLTATAFCAERGLSKASFQRWRQRRADLPGERQTFVPLNSPDEDEGKSRQRKPWTLELDLGDGMTLRLQHG